MAPPDAGGYGDASMALFDTILEQPLSIPDPDEAIGTPGVR